MKKQKKKSEIKKIEEKVAITKWLTYIFLSSERKIFNLKFTFVFLIFKKFV